MMFAELNASGYGFSYQFYIAEFEEILSKIIGCHHLMLNDNITLSNNENEIRNILLINYLKNNAIRSKLGFSKKYLFDREVPEDKTIGRTDIKVQTQNTFEDTAAYYIIECKRLGATNQKGKTGLNAEYIKNGICRFVSNTYSTHYRTNGMIGFVVESLDISQNVKLINGLLKSSFTQANTIQELIHHKIVLGFDFSYCSRHNVKKDNILLYHVMLDFSKNTS